MTIAVAVLAALLAAAVAVALAYPRVFAAPRGERIATAVSPDGTWTAATYYVSFDAGAMSTSNSGLWRVEVRPAAGGPSHNVYYDYVPVPDPYSSDVHWVGANSLKVGDHVVDVRATSVTLRFPSSELGFIERCVKLAVLAVVAFGVALGVAVLLTRKRVVVAST